MIPRDELAGHIPVLAAVPDERSNDAVNPGFELFDHTADMGVRVWAPSMNELIAPAMAGFYSTIGELVPSVDSVPWKFETTTHDPAPELLLRDFLTELLILLERDHRMLSHIDRGDFRHDKLSVDGAVSPIDAARSVMFREVKAVTYHELNLRPVAGGFEATFIVDI